MLVSYAGTLLLPAAILRLLLPDTKNFLGFYIAFQFAFMVMTLLVSILTQSLNEPFTSWLAPVPMSALLLNLFNNIPVPVQPSFLLLNSVATEPAWHFSRCVHSRHGVTSRQTCANIPRTMADFAIPTGDTRIPLLTSRSARRSLPSSRARRRRSIASSSWSRRRRNAVRRSSTSCSAALPAWARRRSPTSSATPWAPT